MTKHSVKVSILILLGLFIIGCRTLSPVYNVESATIMPASGTEVGMDNIKTAITQAGSRLGWTMKPAGDGHLVATLFVRQHMAQVDIKFDSKSYSIQYNDSQNLQYNDGDGSIHPNYNKWVQRLQRNIDARLATL